MMCEKCLKHGRHEVMLAHVRLDGVTFTCRICNSVVKPIFDPYKFDLRDWSGRQCYNCMNMDTSEADDSQNIPGRCLVVSHRIFEEEMPEDGSCEYFVFRRTLMYAKLMGNEIPDLQVKDPFDKLVDEMLGVQ